MVVTFATVVELKSSRFKANKPVYMNTLKAMLSAGEFVCQSDGSVGRLFDVASFQDIPINEQPLLPNPCLPNQDSCRVLLHRYRQPMDYPELAAHIPADPLIVELPGLFSSFLIWVPLTDLTTIFFVFNHSCITQQSFLHLFSSFLIWVPLTDLTTIFFVFNHSSITQQSFFPHGIAIAAYTRKRRDINGVSEIAEDEYSELPFLVGSNS